MNDKGTDKRPRMFMVEHAVLTDYDLKPNEGWVYIWIVSHINGKTGDAFPSLSTLAKETKLSKPTVVNSIHHLEEIGLIEVEHTTKSNGSAGVNHYRLLSAQPLTRVVNVLYQGGKRALPGVVNDVDSNYIESNNNELTKDKDSAPVGADSAVPEPTAAMKSSMIAGLDDMMGAMGFHRVVPADTVPETPPPDSPPALPAPVGDGKEKKLRAADPLFDLVALHSFGLPPKSAELLKQGGRIGKIVAWLKKTLPDCSSERVGQFYRWYAQQYPGVCAPKDDGKFSEHFLCFAATCAPKPVADPHAPIINPPLPKSRWEGYVAKGLTR